MAACGHSADGQLGLAFEKFPDAFHLLVKVAALRWSSALLLFERIPNFRPGFFAI